MAQIIDGKEVAARLREDIKKQAAKFFKKENRKPGLAVVIVGEDPASQVYVKNKIAACEQVGFESVVHRLDNKVTEKKLRQLIKSLNANQTIDGILVQLPLPKHINEREMLALVKPQKDVDGFHTINAGALFLGEECTVACTPAGCIELIKSTGQSMKGKHAVVVGRSNIVGKPVAMLLLQEHCTVTIAHSRTADLGAITRQADILVAAVGKKHLITANMVKPGSIVIDVGVNREDGKLYGDVDFENAKEIASYITPVPGGVGPMTITMLLKNTLIAAEKKHS